MKAKSILSISIILFTVTSCADFVSLDNPVTQIGRKQVFADDIGVKGALAGIYSQMISSTGFSSGGLAGLTVVGGLSSDELLNYNSSPDYLALFANNVAATSNPVQSNWNEMYLYIYESNSIIEGLQEATNSAITEKVRKQSIAQAKFIRAFCYFYLVNLFGDVPLILTTDYRTNRLASRMSASQVYDQIVKDLADAKNELPTDYSISDGERIQPNSLAATALLARTSLYLGKFPEAETASSEVIDNSAYSLVGLNSAFLANSGESIWQLRPSNPALNTNEAGIMIVVSAAPLVSLTPQTMAAFESGDQRMTAWTRTFTSAGRSFQYVFKYRVRLRNQPVTEYYTVLRLAEQYLIRAEARVRQGKIAEAIQDLNRLRTRANLPALNAVGLTSDQALLLVEKERRVELFAEWGHRWFDLKRTGRAQAVLGPLKPSFTATDLLFPLPEAELRVNPNLTQNPL